MVINCYLFWTVPLAGFFNSNPWAIAQQHVCSLIRNVAGYGFAVLSSSLCLIMPIGLPVTF